MVASGVGSSIKPAIDLNRLRQEMIELAQIGRRPDLPGLHRRGFSDADMAARRFITARMECLGLTVSMDAVGNVLGRWEAGSGPAVLVGSHLDTVPMGGVFDGALGVAAAMECVRCLQAAGFEPGHPIEVIATAEEEGRFGGMLGAQALVGRVDQAWFQSAVDEDGVRLVDAMRQQGLDPDAVDSAARDPATIKVFLELHVEQGPVLDQAGIPIGIVDTISGVFKWSVRLIGEANHAGTTPMTLRRDAFLGLAAFAQHIPDLIAAAGTDQCRATIGAVDVVPNHPHVVPGEVVFSFIDRDVDRKAMQRLAHQTEACLASIASSADLDLQIDKQSWLDPSACSLEIVDLLCRHADSLGLDHQVMSSGAGHDTQFMTELTRAGLIFVPSVGGISHAPEEQTEWTDVEAGANLLLSAVTELAR